MNKNNMMRKINLLVAAMAAAGNVSAMQSMTDGDLSGVTAQDGLTVQISIPQVTAASVTQCMDSSTGCSTLTGADASKLTMSGLSMTKVNLTGAAVAGNINATATIDAFADASNVPGLAITADWDRNRIKVDQMLLGTTAKSAGSFALDASGHFELVNKGGLFNHDLASNDAKLYLRMDDANFFFRNSTAANAPEVLLNNLDFLWDMPAGKVGVNSQGLLIEGDVNFNLTFDMRYEGAPATAFTLGTDAQDVPILRYGWTGGLDDAQVRAGSGGSWLNTSLTGADPSQKYDRTAKTQGINLGMHWNYKPDFRWVVGEVATAANPTPARLEFGGWTNLPNTAQTGLQPALTTFGYDFPLIAIDMLRAGRGPGGLCWGANWEGPASSCNNAVHGGQYIELAPEDHSMGVVIRDGFLRAYSTNVKIIDPDAPLVANRDKTLGWALIYTLGNIDGNLFLRPDERAGKNGMKADVVVMSQTFDVFDKDGDGNQWEQGPNWGYGSHFMIGDTQANLGIGVINSSFLLAADNLFINLMSGGISIGDSDLLTSPQTNSPVRLAFNGRFGGGDLPNMTNLVNISDIGINMEFDRFHFMMKPPTGGQTYLGMEATVRFADLDAVVGNNNAPANFAHTDSASADDPGSFITLGEPGRPEATFRMAGVTGWLATRNGRLQLKPDLETPADTPAQLVLENDLLIGRSVSNVAGAELMVGRVELSQPGAGGVINYNNLGSMVIPSGQWYSRIALQPK